MKGADAACQTQQYKEAADLLRAAEHLSFAVLHIGAGEDVSPELKRVIEEEVEHLIERSVEHSSHHGIPKVLLALSARFVTEARSAMRRTSYGSALEFARGAEALSHVHPLETSLDLAGTAQKHLSA